jgi:cytoskeletal protein RodZ
MSISRLRPPDNFRFQYWRWQFPDKIDCRQPLIKANDKAREGRLAGIGPALEARHPVRGSLRAQRGRSNLDCAELYLSLFGMYSGSRRSKCCAWLDVAHNFAEVQSECMVHDVFISHAHKDKSVADAICEKLESAGVRCWIAGRDISAGEDRTAATWNAIGSSRVMVLLLSENANAAPHIQREIAHAFYTKRIIIPLRLTDKPPRRDFLFYLGDVRWFDVFGAPAEQRLEALAASISEMIPCRAVSRDPMPPPNFTKTATTSNRSKSGITARRSPHHRTLKILKSIVIGACLFVVASLFAFWPWQTEHKNSPEESNLHSIHSVPDASVDSSPQATEDASAGKSAHTYTRFGLWSASKTGPTPSFQQGRPDTPSSTLDTQPASAMSSSPSNDQKPAGAGESSGVLDSESARSLQEDTTRMSNPRQVHQGKLRSKRHNGRFSKSKGFRFADIKGRLRTLWHQIVARSK